MLDKCDGNLVYFTAISYIFATWYILVYFSCFGMLCHEKSGNPVPATDKPKPETKFLRHVSLRSSYAKKAASVLTQKMRNQPNRDHSFRSEAPLPNSNFEIVPQKRRCQTRPMIFLFTSADFYVESSVTLRVTRLGEFFANGLLFEL
jgi:hypothetical protein